MSHPATDLLAAALDYARRGWRVVPLYACVPDPRRTDGELGCSCGKPDCGSQGKHPRFNAWQKEASADPAVVARWWQKWPDSNVGVALGPESGIVAIDVDTKAGEQLVKELAGGNVERTALYRTGKGHRLLYAVPDGLPAPPVTRVVQFGGTEGVRFQSTGGQCVMPPSLHPAEKLYAWVEGRDPESCPPAPMPEWLVAEMCRPTAPEWSDQGARDAFAEGKDFNRDADWFRDVLEPAGFKPFGQVNGVLRFTRPGKRSGISATVGHYRARDGSPALYVFSGSIPGLEALRCYDKFGAYAKLHHNGDFAAAGAELARKGFGRPAKPAVSPSGASAADKPAEPVWKRKPGTTAPEGITAADLIALTFDPPKFLISNLLTEGLTVLGGKPKHGKSWLALLLGWAVAAGEALDGRSATQGEVLYLALEDTRRRLQSRIAKLRDALRWPVPETLQLQTQWPRATEGGLYHIAEWAERFKDRPKLVIVDTLARFRTPPKGNANSYSDDYEAIGGLKQMLDHYGMSGLCLHHTRKLRSDDPFDEISGTLAITGAADSIWMLDTQKKGEDARLYVTGRDLADATVPIKFQQDSGRWIVGDSADGIDTTGRGEAGKAGSATKVEQCAAWLRDFLRVYAYPSKEIETAAKAAGYAFSALRDAKAALGKQGTGEIENHKFGDREWWSGLGPRYGWKYRPGSQPSWPEGSVGSESSPER